MTPHMILHCLRNPHGHSGEEFHKARLEAADLIERLQKNVDALEQAHAVLVKIADEKEGLTK